MEFRIFFEFRVCNLRFRVCPVPRFKLQTQNSKQLRSRFHHPHILIGGIDRHVAVQFDFGGSGSFGESTAGQGQVAGEGENEDWYRGLVPVLKGTGFIYRFIAKVLFRIESKL